MGLVFSRSEIVGLITWMRSQTQDNTVSNIFLGDLLESMLTETPDFNNLTPIEKRQLKNAMDSIITGSVTLNQLQANFYQDYIKLKFSQTGYQDQVLMAEKGKYKPSWLFGEAPYTVTIAEAIPAGNPPVGTYFSFPTVDNQNIVFGGSLGGVPAGFNLGTFENSFNFNMNSFITGQESHFVPVSVLFTNTVADNKFPASFGGRAEGVLRKTFQNGVVGTTNIMDTAGDFKIAFGFPKEMATSGGYFNLSTSVNIDVKKNGTVVQNFIYPQGKFLQTMQIGWNEEFLGGFAENDLIEIEIYDTPVE